MMFWEDFEVGGRFEMGRHTFSEEEILEFGRRFDPQAFHTDPEAAKRGFFGGVIASGFHTCAVAMRIMVDSYLARAASLGAPGLENVRWPKPVRPGRYAGFHEGGARRARIHHPSGRRAREASLGSTEPAPRAHALDGGLGNVWTPSRLNARAHRP
jgi:hypothetical protein